MDAAYEAPGSLWRVRIQEERYAVDVKLPEIEAGDNAAATSRLVAAGLECSWIISGKVPKLAGEVVLFTPAAARRKRTVSMERRVSGK